ncbi:MAG: hypothetical protein ACLFTK_13180 [Anaerolineales bacterium]
MTTLLITLGILIVLGALIATTREGVVPWLKDMHRLNPGRRHRAEWMAPPNVLANVQRDYLDFIDYSTQRLPQGWLAYMRDLDTYLADEMLREQRASLGQRLRHDRGRMVEVLRADHSLQVRHFSADGLRCILIDHQRAARLATYDYWSGRRIHTQDMGDLCFVYEMHYDLARRRWRIARFVQRLPLGYHEAHMLFIENPSHPAKGHNDVTYG